MREVFRATLRARGLRGTVLTHTILLLVLGTTFVLFDARASAVPIICCLYALVVSNGLIGEDVRDGSVGLLLARPLTRTGYLAGRLLGAGTLTLAFTAALLAIAVAVRRPGADVFATLAVSAVTSALWTVAVIFFFSTFLPGRADALCALALWLSTGALHMARTEMQRPWLERSLEWLWDNASSTVMLVGLQATPASVTDLLRWASNLLLLVLFGVVIFNRRQFGYAD